MGEGPHGYNDTSAEDRNPYGIDDKLFSSFMRLIRVSARIHRFIKRLKSEKTSTDPITLKELEEARILLIKSI